jgi:hypothetical protein
MMNTHNGFPAEGAFCPEHPGKIPGSRCPIPDSAGAPKPTEFTTEFLWRANSDSPRTSPGA